jgi:required for meiotic nuclear division protein 1
MTDPISHTLPATFAARAVYVGERIDLKAIESSSRLAVAPTTVRAGVAGVAVLFRYGAIVFFNVTPIEEVAFLGQMERFVSAPFERREAEEVQLQVRAEQDERPVDGVVSVKKVTVGHLQCVADALAKSVVLAHTESSMARVFDGIEPLSKQLERDGTIKRRSKALLQHIGSALQVQTQMVGRVEVLEKPELLWDHPELELLFARLEDEYELRERHHAVEHKLQLISKTAETLLGLLQHDRALRVEWYVVLLIVVEIVLTLYELFVR